MLMSDMEQDLNTRIMRFAFINGCLGRDDYELSRKEYTKQYWDAYFYGHTIY